MCVRFLIQFLDFSGITANTVKSLQSQRVFVCLGSVMMIVWRVDTSLSLPSPYQHEKPLKLTPFRLLSPVDRYWGVHECVIVGERVYTGYTSAMLIGNVILKHKIFYWNLLRIRGLAIENSSFTALRNKISTLDYQRLNHIPNLYTYKRPIF